MYYNGIDSIVKEVIIIFTQEFWKDMVERVIATFAQALGAILIGAGTGLLDTDWVGAASVAGMAALLAVLKSLGAFASNHETGASFGTAIPKGNVAAVESKDVAGKYEAEEASALPEGTPVDVVPEEDSGISRSAVYPSDFDHSDRE